MTYVMSDVHACYKRFRRMLDEIGFSPGVDHLYIVGDSIDRGPDGLDVLKHAMLDPSVTLLMGNHEDMFSSGVSLDGVADRYMYDIWMNNGGGMTLPALRKLPRDEQAAILAYASKLPEEMEIEAAGKRFHLVHACPGRNRGDRLWKQISPFLPPKPVPGRTTIVGHTPVCYLYPSSSGYLAKCEEHMSIYHGNGFIDLDCGSGKGKSLPKNALACLRLEDMQEFYVTD